MSIINLWHDTTASEPQPAPSYYNLDSPPIVCSYSVLSLLCPIQLFFSLALIVICRRLRSESINQANQIKSNESNNPNQEQYQIQVSRKKKLMMYNNTVRRWPSTILPRHFMHLSSLWWVCSWIGNQSVKHLNLCCNSDSDGAYILLMISSPEYT